MSTTTTTTEPAPAPAAEAAQGWFDRFVANYREDHKHPVNHFMHVYIGWPICALGVIALPFRPWWFVGLFALGYAVMWTGHFVFERNLPTVFTHPTTPFVMAYAVTRSLVVGLFRLVVPAR